MKTLKIAIFRNVLKKVPFIQVLFKNLGFSLAHVQSFVEINLVFIGLFIREKGERLLSHPGAVSNNDWISHIDISL